MTAAPAPSPQQAAVLGILLMHGVPLTVDEVRVSMGHAAAAEHVVLDKPLPTTLASSTIRNHLDALEHKGLVHGKLRTQAPGRPVEWEPTEAGKAAGVVAPQDNGCPFCHAPPDEMCTTAAGRARNDHKARAGATAPQ